MRIVANNFEELTTRRGLQCVWESICEGGQTRLVARWVDPESKKARLSVKGEANSGDPVSGPGLLLGCDSTLASLAKGESGRRKRERTREGLKTLPHTFVAVFEDDDEAGDDKKHWGSARKKQDRKARSFAKDGHARWWLVEDQGAEKN
jgi:hypothetical protein